MVEQRGDLTDLTGKSIETNNNMRSVKGTISPDTGFSSRAYRVKSVLSMGIIMNLYCFYFVVHVELTDLF
jgi:hypothetical protein